MIGFLFHHGWHALGLIPLLAIIGCVFAWPVAGPILARRPWIAAVLLAMVAGYVQQWRIVALKAEVASAATKRAKAEQDAADAIAARDAVIAAAKQAKTEADGRAAGLVEAFKVADRRAKAERDRLLTHPIAPGCDPAVADLDAYLAQERP